ncbi:ComEC/Rec2 family competence protein [Luteolibacter marinus]|uniref:ComEC/Rec2 family competence protein n=1 Tax=Luteolibacter marinus TaxID=2776705 RepID=UPI001867A41D|nr:ComEC/Rec2 family competence protein [Luteolibacter marinus]
MRAGLRQTVERHPLLWAAVLAVAAVVAADGKVIAGSLAAAIVLGLFLVAGRPRVAISAMLCAAAAAGLHGWRTMPQDAARRWIEADRSHPAKVVAQVISEPRSSGHGWSALVVLRDGGVPGKVWWRGGGPPAARGETIEARGRFVPVPPPRNPGEFDLEDWLHRQGAWGVFEAQGVARSVAAPPFVDRMAQRWRARFRRAVTTGLDPASREAAVIRAMVLGENPDDDDALIESYRSSGTLHVFSVSGMHVAMVGAVVWLVLRCLRVPRRPAVVVILLAMLGYAWITGMKPPATRAVTMAGVLLAAFLVRRRPDLLNALGLALLITLMADGHLIFRAGVQLSFGVVLAIGLGMKAATGWFAVIERKEPYLPLSLYGRWRAAWLDLRRKVAAGLGASSAASIGSLPLTLWHFGFVAPISVLASPLIGLPVFILMALALLAALLAPLSAVGPRINRVNAGVAWTCTAVAEGFAAVPGGNFAIPLGRPADDFLIVYDVGYGGGAACLHDDGSSVLFDTGSQPGFRRSVLPSLRRMALLPESLVLSHPESGHVGGAVEALDALPLRQVLMPVERSRSSTFRRLEAATAERRVATTVGREGEFYRISDEARLEVIHAPDPRDWSAVADERVMVVRLHWHGWRILFTSDAGLATERAMMESGRDLRADVIVAGRHRHDGSLGDDFLAAVKPRAIVVTHADHPPQERVPDNWVEACGRAGIHVFHQGRAGAVTILPGEDGVLVLRGFLDGSSLSLLPQP